MEQLHNITEDTVLKVVDELFAAETSKPVLGYCTCPQCRLDVACYVLNRVAPEYVISGRGVAYTSNDYQDNVQRTADVVTFANDGWRRINQTRRPHFDHAGKARAGLPEPPVFNFPTIIGRLLNGATFGPMDGVQVSLYRAGKLVSMIDPNWQNPCTLFASSGGTYIFWPVPEKAHAQGESKIVEFEVRAVIEGYDDVNHFFTVQSASDNFVQTEFSLQRSQHLQDIILFPPSDEAEEARA